MPTTPTPSEPSAPATLERAEKRPQAWLLSAVIFASTAALLGTSQGPDPVPPLASEPSFENTYSFERLAIDGGFVELTRDRPSATVFVTLRADDLGRDGAPSTNLAQVFVKGDVTASDLEDTARPATLSIALSSPDTPNVARRTTADHFERSQALAFTGDCQNPKAGTCAARFRVDVTRDDDGANGGTVRFDWSFDATASGTLSSSIQDADLGPFDPPWTIEISQ